MRVFTISDIDRHGVERVMREALAILQGAAFLHASLDLDAVDPMFAPGVEHRCGAASPTARPTSPSSSSPNQASSTRSSPSR